MREGQGVLRIASAAALLMVLLLIGTHASAGRAGGKLIWKDRLDVGPNDFPSRDSVAVSGNGVFVAGGVTGVTGAPDDFTDLLVRAYDARKGRLLWEDRFDLAAGEDFALGITTGGGRVFVTGDATNAAQILVPVIRAYDERTGALLWQDVGAHQGLYDSAAVLDGRLFVIGVVGEDAVPVPGSRFFFRADWLVRAYDARTGALLWESRSGAPDPVGAVQLDRPVTVVARDGRVFVGGRGSTGPGPGSNWLVRAYDARTGALLWQDDVPAGFFGQPSEMVVAGERLVAVGAFYSQVSPLNEDWLIRAYDTGTGQLVWEDQVDTGVSEYERAFDVAATGGRVFVGGTVGATCGVNVTFPDNCDFLLRAYRLESGRLLWEDRLDEAPLDELLSVAAEGDRFYAVGYGANGCDASGLPTNCDGIVRAYRADTGRLVWDARVDNAGTDDYGTGVAVRDGRVFAIGAVLDASFASDLFVRAYARGGDDPDDHGHHHDHGHHDE